MSTITKGRACGGKRQYGKAEARRRAKQQRGRWRAHIYSYPCPFCDHWHIGHRPGSGHR